MVPCYRHGYSVENRFEAVSENDKKLLQEMYGIPKSVEMRAIYNSKNAEVMLRKIFKGPKPTKVKIVFTLKPKHFTASSGDSEISKTTGNSADTISDKICEQSFKQTVR